MKPSVFSRPLRSFSLSVVPISALYVTSISLTPSHWRIGAVSLRTAPVLIARRQVSNLSHTAELDDHNGASWMTIMVLTRPVSNNGAMRRRVQRDGDLLVDALLDQPLRRRGEEGAARQQRTEYRKNNCSFRV